AGLAEHAAASTCEQPPYSILVRAIENQVLPVCVRNDVGIVVWAPLNGGWLTGKYQGDAVDASWRAERKGEHFDHRDVAMRERKRDLVARLITIADEAGIGISDLAIGFILANPAITSLLVGPRTPEQLTSLLGVAHAPLGRDVLAAIDTVVAPGITINPADKG
ncbi:MAG: aldo/keto reductase, partial [Ilumatobacteraceae bacterium]